MEFFPKTSILLLLIVSLGCLTMSADVKSNISPKTIKGGIDTACTDQEAGALVPCTPYIRRGGSKTPTPFCCSGIDRLARSGPGAKSVCQCFIDVFNKNPGDFVLEKLLGLPETCKAKGLHCPR